jgi:hypothetical protein
MVAQPITVSAVIGEDRRLVVDLPADTPTGKVNLIIFPAPTPSTNPARESLRAKLLAAGALRTRVDVPSDAVPLRLEERIRLGTIPPGSPTAEELVNEDRGEW